MSIAAINNHTAASASAALEYGIPAGLEKPGSGKGSPSPADIKKAAAQFEAIIMRQLLAPSIEPLMSGGLGGGAEGASSGGGIYGHMMTEVLADNLAQSGGIGLGKMLEKQFSPASVAAPLSSKSLLKPSTSSTPLL
jgi:peptidoglycan hydrolase FlgJ